MTNAVVNDDLTREEIVDRYRKRIAEGKRTKLTRVEREQLAYLLVETLIHLSEAGEDSKDVIQALCQEEIELLEEGYPKTSINSSYLPIYTRLIKDAIASGQLKLTDLNSYEKAELAQESSDEGTEWKHYALDFLSYNNSAHEHDEESSDTHIGQPLDSDNSMQPDINYLVDVDAYLKKAQELLNSDVPEEVAIALCSLTGRRHTELIVSEPFEKTEYPYLIRNQEWSDATSSMHYGVLTLIPAQEILPHLRRWQTMVAQLHKESMQGVHGRAFIARVNHRIRKVFEFTQIVPVLENSKTVSIQCLKDLYGAIALYFFCPPTPHQYDFVQHYLSFLVELEPPQDFNLERVRKQLHYLPQRRGKAVQAIGVKRPDHGSVPLPADSSSVDDSSQLDSASDTSSLSNHVPILDRLESVIVAQSQTIADQTQTLNQFAAEMQTLRERIQSLERTEKEMSGQAQKLVILQQECQELRQENQTLRLAQQKMDALKAILLGHEARSNFVDQSSQSAQPLPSVPRSEQSAKRAQSSASQTSARPSQPNASKNNALGKLSSLSSDLEPYRLVPTKASRAQQRAASIVEAIQSWNRQHPQRSFAITKGLLEHEFGINRKAASEFLEGNRKTLLNYYQLIGVNNERGHNRQPGRDIESLKAFVDRTFRQSR